MPDSAPPSPRLSALANRLNSVAIHLLRRISRDDDDDGVTGARLSALSVLVYGGPRSLGELAAAERVATPTMSRTIEAMVREGLVQRRTSPADRRALVLTATEEGKRLLEAGRARRIRHLTAELAHLSAEELAALDRAAEVLGRLQRIGGPADREAP